MCSSGPERTIAASVGNAAEMSSRFISAVERIADALDRIAPQQALAPDEPVSPTGGVSALRSDAAPAGQRDLVPSSAAASADRISNMESQLAEVHALLKKQERLLRPTEKKSYAVPEIAALTGYKEWTIRQACNKGRIKGKKGDDGRWRVPHDELVRLQDEGLPAE